MPHSAVSARTRLQGAGRWRALGLCAASPREQGLNSPRSHLSAARPPLGPCPTQPPSPSRRGVGHSLGGRSSRRPAGDHECASAARPRTCAGSSSRPPVAGQPYRPRPSPCAQPSSPGCGPSRCAASGPGRSTWLVRSPGTSGPPAAGRSRAHHSHLTPAACSAWAVREAMLSAACPAAPASQRSRGQEGNDQPADDHASTRSMVRRSGLGRPHPATASRPALPLLSAAVSSWLSLATTVGLLGARGQEAILPCGEDLCPKARGDAGPAGPCGGEQPAPRTASWCTAPVRRAGA